MTRKTLGVGVASVMAAGLVAGSLQVAGAHDSGIVVARPAGTTTAGVADGSFQPQGIRQHTRVTGSPTSTMTVVTANIGRYNEHGCHPSRMHHAIKNVATGVNKVADGAPRLIGWQEINESDCADEVPVIKKNFPHDKGWQHTLRRPTADHKKERIKVPTVAQNARKSAVRVVYGSPGLPGVSPTRFITVARYKGQNLSHINLHFIQHPERFGKQWNMLWNKLKHQVKREHDAGFNVVVTADWNRHIGGGWSPKQVHPRAEVVMKDRIDHIVAVPAAGYQKDVRTPAKGAIRLGIDGHSAHWVKVRFVRR